MNIGSVNALTIITAGSTYLDIDAYACMVALAELLKLRGENAVAFSTAPCNYSVADFLIKENQVVRKIPAKCKKTDEKYIIVDVSDPGFIGEAVPLDRVVEVYDHHTGFEKYWDEKIGDGAHIEFIGAAATLIFREWKKAGLVDKMSCNTAMLLIAAILDNTLNLTSQNTTKEDKDAFKELCILADVGDEWRNFYFSEVQKKIESDLKNALLKDIKKIGDNPILPSRVAQICIWDAEKIVERLPEIKTWFGEDGGSWMINLIDIKRNCSYFVCDDVDRQEKLSMVFGIRFEDGFAKLPGSYLRKEIIKKTQNQGD